MNTEMPFDDYFDYTFAGYAVEALCYAYVLLNQFMGVVV